MATPELQPLDKLTPEVCLIIEPTREEAHSRFAAFLVNAKKFSDLGIAIPALLYTCGFVVLGCYAEDNSLGLQVFPAIQFFSAGAGFLIIFASFVLIMVALRQLMKRVFDWLSSESKFSKVVKQAVAWMGAISLVTLYLAGFLHFEKIRIAAMYGLILCLFFSAEGWMQKMARFYLYFVGFVVGLVTLALYAFSAYPKIPSSFGGGEPRYARVQVDMNALPGVIAQQFIHSGHPPSDAKGELEAEVFLVTDSSVVIRIPRPEPLGQKDAGSPTKPKGMILQLRRSDVSAIFWDSRR
jgi:hypothetical protein